MCTMFLVNIWKINIFWKLERLWMWFKDNLEKLNVISFYLFCQPCNSIFINYASICYKKHIGIS